jgi:transposase
MTASYNISFLSSPEQAESRVSKKGYRSSNYNNYMVEVVDFDNESHTFEVDARSESEASELAADMAMSAGVQVSYCNVYLYVDSF